MGHSLFNYMFMNLKLTHGNVSFLRLQPLQGRWAQDSSLLQLPHVDEYCVKAFRKAKVGGLPELMHSKSGYEAVAKVLREELAEDQIEDVFQVGERFLEFGISPPLSYTVYHRFGGRRFVCFGFDPASAMVLKQTHTKRLPPNR